MISQNLSSQRLGSLAVCYLDLNSLGFCSSARHKMASSKMKQLRQGGSKDTDGLDNEDNEELFGDIGLDLNFSSLSCT